MLQLQVISRKRHLHKRWERSVGHVFAACEPIVVLVAAEFSKAALAMPTGFVKQNDAFVPVVLTGFALTGNLFIDAQGYWTGDYLPAALRSYPFQVIHNPENDQQALCIDEESGQVTDGPQVQAFFTQAGEPAQPVMAMLNFLIGVAHNRTATAHACAVLARYGLIQPWAASFATDAGEVKLGGLFEVNEAALNRLPGQALQEMAESGGLQLAYCQWLSRLRLPALAQRSQACARSALPTQPVLATPAVGLGLAFLRQAGTVSFANLF